MSTMNGLFTLAAARASRKNRSMTVVDAESSEASTLMATFLSSASWTASYTAAIPPRPISRVTRYLPMSTVDTVIFDSGFGSVIESRDGGDPGGGRPGGGRPGRQSGKGRAGPDLGGGTKKASVHAFDLDRCPPQRAVRNG